MSQTSLLPQRKTHIAIMKKSWKLTNKILEGKKTIESRWSLNKARPWGQIESGDIVYFKDSGEPITLKTTVNKVISFANLNPDEVKEILKKYGEDAGIEEKDLNLYYQLFKNKKYCILIFLKEVQKIEPFSINKDGFGNMAAWITVEDINKIKLK